MCSSYCKEVHQSVFFLETSCARHVHFFLGLWRLLRLVFSTTSVFSIRLCGSTPRLHNLKAFIISRLQLFWRACVPNGFQLEFGTGGGANGIASTSHGFIALGCAFYRTSPLFPIARHSGIISNRAFIYLIDGAMPPSVRHSWPGAQVGTKQQVLCR